MEVGSEAVIGGETAGFAELVVRHHALVCAVAYGVTGNRAVSEDVAQEAFVAAWRSRHELRDPSRFRAWICAIARHLALNVARLRRHDPLEDEAIANDELDLHARLEHAQRQALVWEALAAMPERYRVPLVLFYREGKSATEVATQLGISTANALQRLARGRRHLKRGIEDMVDRTLADSKPAASRVAAVVAAIGSDIELSPFAGAAIEAARASSRPASWTTVIMKVAIVGCGVAAVVTATAWGCAGWERSARTGDAEERDDNGGAATMHDGAEAIAASDASAPTSASASASARRRESAGTGSGASAMLPAYRLSIIDEQHVAVNLEGGPSAIMGASEALGIEPPRPPEQAMRKLEGRVVDRDGAPVHGAVVLAGPHISMSFAPSISARAGDETDRRGRFDLEVPAGGPCSLLALHPEGWSAIERLSPDERGASIELQLVEPARVVGHTRREREVEPGVVVASANGLGVRLKAATDGEGNYELLLPPGSFELGFVPGDSAGMGEALVHEHADLRPGTRLEWNPRVSVGTRLAVDAPVPSGHTERITMVWVYVLAGTDVPPDVEALRARGKSEPKTARGRGHGGEDLDEIFEFADLPAGTYTVCAYAEARRETLPMKCQAIAIDGKDAVEELAITW